MFEADAPNSQITDYAEALWWTSATLTTVGATSEPVTLGGRIVALLIMLGGLVLLGYVAGVLAALLFGKRPENPLVAPAGDVAQGRVTAPSHASPMTEKLPSVSSTTACTSATLANPCWRTAWRTSSSLTRWARIASSS